MDKFPEKICTLISSHHCSNIECGHKKPFKKCSYCWLYKIIEGCCCGDKRDLRKYGEIE